MMSGSVIWLRTDVLFISLGIPVLTMALLYSTRCKVGVVVVVVVVGIQFNPDHVKSLGHIFSKKTICIVEFGC